MEKLPITILMPGNNFSLRVVNCIKETLRVFDVDIKLHYEPSVFAVRNSLLGFKASRGKKQILDIKTDWVLWIDSDCIWKPQDIKDLLNSAIENNLKIVSGWCVINTNEGNISPFFHGVFDKDKPFEINRFKVTTPDLEKLPDIFESPIVGGHFTLVKTNVYEEVDAPWYDTIQYQNYGITNQIGEDVAFCYRAFLKGIQSYVNKNVKVGHEKLRVLGL